MTLPLSETQRLVLQELARGNRLSMLRGSRHSASFARWREPPALAPPTVRRSTLRALIGAGYVTTEHDAGLFLPGQTFNVTLAGRQAGGAAAPDRIQAILQEIQRHSPQLTWTTWQRILSDHLGPAYSTNDREQMLAAMRQRGWSVATDRHGKDLFVYRGEAGE